MLQNNFNRSIRGEQRLFSKLGNEVVIIFLNPQGFLALCLSLIIVHYIVLMYITLSQIIYLQAVLLFSWICNGLSNFLLEKKKSYPSSSLSPIALIQSIFSTCLHRLPERQCRNSLFLTFFYMWLKVRLLAGWLVESCLHLLLLFNQCKLLPCRSQSSIFFFLIQNIFCFSFPLDVVSALQYFLKVAVCPQGWLHRSQ